MNYNDDFKRLEGHPEMKEIPESFDSYTPAVATGHRHRKPRKAGAAAVHGGCNGGSILAILGAVAIAGVAFFLSDSHFRNNGQVNYGSVSQKAPRAYQAVEVIEISDGALAQNVDQPQAGAATVAETDAVAVSDGGSTTVAEVETAVADSAPDAVYLFALDGSAIAENAELNAVAKEAVATDSDVAITAYTDESGSADYNLELSDRRADAIADYLVAHGVPRNHISTEGCGETHAFPTPALDRRAEVRLVS